eukprot:SAG22_NODE_179_length_16124_cov_7.355445_10_plen_627_part_00
MLLLAAGGAADPSGSNAARATPPPPVTPNSTVTQPAGSRTEEEDQKICKLYKSSDSDYCDPNYTDPACTLLGDWFGKAVQVVLLLVIGFGSLLVKKWVEEKRTDRPPRDYQTWGMDVAKPGTSQICAHFAGIHDTDVGIMDEHATFDDGNAYPDDARIGDECSWYFISFATVTTLGVAFSFAMFKALARLADKYPQYLGSLQKSGDYSDRDGNINYVIWAKQMLAWCLITIAARFMVLGLLFLGLDHTKHYVAALAKTFACHPKWFLLIVMVSCPVILNIGALWVQDQFLKKKDPAEQETEEVAVAVAGVRGTLDTPLMSLETAAAAAATTAGAALSVAADLEFGRGQKSYRQIQRERRRECMQNCCCVLNGGLILALFIVFFVEVAKDPKYYDPCYLQVRTYPGLGDPATIHDKCGRHVRGCDKPEDGGKCWSNVTFPEIPPHEYNVSQSKCAAAPGENDELDRATTTHEMNQVLERTTLKYLIEHRADLRCPVNGSKEGNSTPLCRCCTAKNFDQSKITRESCGPPNKYTNPKVECPLLGQCCDRSTLASPHKELMDTCSVCNTYRPCDRQAGYDSAHAASARGYWQPAGDVRQFLCAVHVLDLTGWAREKGRHDVAGRLGIVR